MKKALTLLLCLTLLLALTLPAFAAEYPALTGTAEPEWILKYGNVFFSVPIEELLAAGYAYGDIVTVEFLDQCIEVPLCSSYSDVDPGLPGLFARPTDTYCHLAVNMGDFAATYGIAVKTTYEDKSFVWNWAEGVEGPVSFTIRMKQPGGYREQYLLRQLSYTDERADYPDLTDAQYANFRAIETTGMGKGVLYRSCTPINPLHNRNSYADAAFRAAGITVVMNLADDEETARAFEGFDKTYYSTTSFIALNMGVEFTSAEFMAKLADGMRFFAEHPGVYALHCIEGADRAGFVAALLECLMGADCAEITADYMLSYYNYYGVQPGEERYDLIADRVFHKSLSDVFGVEDLQSADLAACAAAYLKACGLTDETIAALKKNLSAPPAAAEPKNEPKTEPIPEPQPEPQSAQDTVYIVRAGDCLWNLAKRFYGDPLQWKRIADANALRDPYIILIGQSLRIPA